MLQSHITTKCPTTDLHRRKKWVPAHILVSFHNGFAIGVGLPLEFEARPDVSVLTRPNLTNHGNKRATVTTMKNSIKNEINALVVALATVSMVVATGCVGTESTAEIPLTPVSESSDDGSADTVAQVAESSELQEFEVPAPEPTADKVVTIGSGVNPGSTAAGSVVTYAVRVRTMKPWHVYAINKPTGVSKPTKLNLKLPEGVTAVGEWDIPEPKKYEDDVFIYEEDVVFRRQLKIADSATGMLNIACKVDYQPCNDQSCKAPTSEVTSMGLEVTAP